MTRPPYLAALGLGALGGLLLFASLVGLDGCGGSHHHAPLLKGCESDRDDDRDEACPTPTPKPTPCFRTVDGRVVAVPCPPCEEDEPCR